MSDKKQSFDDFDIFVLRTYYIFLDDNKGKIECVPRIKSAINDFSVYDYFNNLIIHVIGQFLGNSSYKQQCRGVLKTNGLTPCST